MNLEITQTIPRRDDGIKDTFLFFGMPPAKSVCLAVIVSCIDYEKSQIIDSMRGYSPLNLADIRHILTLVGEVASKPFNFFNDYDRYCRC